jgi:hypothetical protein
MKPLSASELEQLEEWKRAFCNGDKKALRLIFEYCFDEIFASLLLRKPADRAADLLLLEDELERQSADFCKSTLPVYEYLQNRWRKISDNDYSSGLGLIEDIIKDPDAEDAFNLEENPIARRLPATYLYFLKSLSPLGRLYYEARIAHQLENKNGVNLVMFFLANALSMADDNIRATLRNEEALHEPIIPRHLLNEALTTFTANTAKADGQRLSEILFSLKKNKLHQQSAFKTTCQRIRVEVYRAHSSFRRLANKCHLLSELESLIVISNHYLPIDDPFELWLHLNLEARDNTTLTKELRQHQLLHADFLKFRNGLRRKALTKRIYISKQFEQDIIGRFRNIQNDIETKLNESIEWEIN